MPTVSVIVPVYNVENKVSRCIDSILAQTYADFELIIVDDGSLDKSGKICDEYALKDTRIKIFHQHNQGSSAARNHAVKTACGDYIAFVDSDDYVHENYLKTLYDAALIYKADMVKCNYYSVSEDGNLTECKHKYADNAIFDKEAIRDCLYHDIFYDTDTTGYFSPWNKLFRKKMIIENRVYMNETMSFGEDMLFVMEYLKYCSKVVFLADLLYYYEVLSTGLFSKYRESFKNDIMKCYTSLIEQTKPDDATIYDYFPLNKKYWYYINRHIIGIIENESKKNYHIYMVLSDTRVKTLFERIAVLSDEEAKSYNIMPNEMKVPRLVADNRIRKAAFVERYQLDSTFWLRKIRRALRI